MAGLPQNPNHYRPDRFPQRAAARRDHVLERMVATGKVTVNEAAEARAEPIGAAWRPLPQDRKGTDLPPADGAMPTLLWLAGRYPGPALRTTLDAAAQRQAAEAASEQLRILEPSGVSAAAVVVLDNETAECLAAVSLTRGADGAPTPLAGLDLTRRPRSTGSVLKPFIYAAAFDAGVCAPAR